MGNEGVAKYVLGVSMSNHDRSAALLRDGLLVGAVAEERLDRRKRSQGFYHSDQTGKVLPPLRAITALLREHGLHMNQISLVVCGRSVRPCREDLLEALPLEPAQVVEPATPGHHLAHAYSAYATAPFPSTAVLVLDEQGYRAEDGRFERGSWFFGSEGPLELERRFFGADDDLSLGMFFDVFAALTGLSEAGLPAAGKLMALAGYGSFQDRWPRLVSAAPDGDVSIPLAELDDFLENVAGLPVNPEYSGWELGTIRDIGTKYNPIHWSTQLAKDLACFAQRELERGVLHTAQTLREHTGSRYLSYAGGVALNCTANSKLKSAGFADVFAHPAATDDGCAIGLAYYGWIEELSHPRKAATKFNVYLGPQYRSSARTEALHRYSLEGYAVPSSSEKVAEALADGKLVCRFSGRSEWGPRALGNRSILADPRRTGIVDLINSRVKFREPFRPFGVSVATEAAGELLELEDVPSSLGPFMLAVARIRDRRLQEVIHTDGTVRYQLVDATSAEYHRIIHDFAERTDLPAIINTSFNTLGEPLVEDPADAVRQFLLCGADVLVLDDSLVDLTAVPAADRTHALDAAEHDTRTDPLAVALKHEAAGYTRAAEKALARMKEIDKSRGIDYLRQYHALEMRLAALRGDTDAAMRHAERVLRLSGLPQSAVDAARLIQLHSGFNSLLTPSAAQVLTVMAEQGGLLRVLQQLLPGQVQENVDGEYV